MLAREMAELVRDTKPQLLFGHSSGLFPGRLDAQASRASF
jgi:hypothetical protein